MKVKTHDYNEVTVIEMQGDLDSDAVDLFQNTVTDIIANGKTSFVIDLRSVGFIDGEGLERLLWAKDYCIENNCLFKLAGLDENCKKILELTRLSDDFDCYSELAEAVKSFA